MGTMLKYSRRAAHEVRFGGVVIGGDNPIAIQSMTNTPTANIELSVAQTMSIANAGAEIVRLTAQGKKEGEALAPIMAQLKENGCSAAIVADIHFTPEIAMIAAEAVDKVRINPGNFRTSNGELEQLIEICRRRGVALRIGVNHGSLAKRIFDKYGDTPEGMVASAMEFLTMCRRADFNNVVVSMKSSNTRVMVHAYRLLVEAMEREAMTYPLHLGVTEAGDGIEGRIKSAVGIGALLADGIGDTLRVSLTEAPENEVPVGRIIANYFADREGEFEIEDMRSYSPTSFQPRTTAKPIIHSEITSEYDVVEAITKNPTHEWRAAILNCKDSRPKVLRRRYDESDAELVAIYAAADMGQLLIDGLAEGVWIDAPALDDEQIKDIELMLLQASRLRFTRTEYIACPSCGRTLYDIQSTLAAIKARTSHLKDLKIGVMGCIVNGPGEMADADYGYVGSSPEHITLYRGREIVERNIHQSEALDHLIEIIKRDGRWHDPQ
ncbi:MAG: (E)-4-hydroxy-3-methylbut-2-enyl-diphosphate synthase [Alistipes sp.]|nr:(E)-4-hydroxy-3-methylbut-2-enyl-diphosphate synthase [Alistipes sp.]